MFNDESINYFELGSLSNQKDFIKNLLNNFTEDELLKAAIIKKNNDNKYIWIN